MCRERGGGGGREHMQHNNTDARNNPSAYVPGGVAGGICKTPTQSRSTNTKHAYVAETPSPPGKGGGKVVAT